MRHALAALLLGAAAYVSATPALAADLTISVPEAAVAPGDTVDASVAWSLGEGVFVSGRFRAWWKLQDDEGRTLATGRRSLAVPLRESEEVPYRFRLPVRIPRRARA